MRILWIALELVALAAKCSAASQPPTPPVGYEAYAAATAATVKTASGHYEARCNGTYCVRVWVPDAVSSTAPTPLKATAIVQQPACMYESPRRVRHRLKRCR